MVKQFFFIWIVLGGLNLACQPEDEILAEKAIALQFDKDTVHFDTLFTGELSITKRLRVSNPSGKAVLIERIELSNGDQSPYLLYVNGRSGKQFGQQQILAGDSLLLLLEARLPETTHTAPYLASDLLVLENKGLRQELPLVGYGQNALFVGDSVLSCNTSWDSPLPYVIKKSVLVDSLCTLQVSKGARLYFKPGAYLYVKGSIHAEGDTAKADRILFRNHRLGKAYENQPGQWGGIIFLPGSKNNRLLYTNIRNAEYGIYLGTPDQDDEPDLELGHCKIENSLYAGIICYTSDLLAYNTLVSTSARYTVANLAGGNYRYQHCTFVNYFTRREPVPALLLSDYVVLEDETEISENLNFSMANSLIWGNLSGSSEVVLDIKQAEQLHIAADHNLLRTSDDLWQGNGNILGTDLGMPRFEDPFSYDYRPDSLSPARDAGLSLNLPHDLEGIPRDEKPDMGAFEYRPQQENQ